MAVKKFKIKNLNFDFIQVGSDYQPSKVKDIQEVHDAFLEISNNKGLIVTHHLVSMEQFNDETALLVRVGDKDHPATEDEMNDVIRIIKDVCDETNEEESIDVIVTNLPIEITEFYLEE